MTAHDWVYVLGITVSALLTLAPWMFMVHAKLAVIASRIVDLSEKVGQLATTSERLWSQYAAHEARLDTHDVELNHMAERLREIG